MRRRIRQAALVPLIAALTLSAAPGVSQDSARGGRCEALAGREIRPGLTIATAVQVAAAPARAAARPGAPPQPALPAHCRLEGTIDPHTGAEGKVYAIGFALALPDEWNGRFLLQGGGGLNGSVGAPTGPVAAGTAPPSPAALR